MIYLLEDEEGIRNFVIYALGRSGIEAEGFGAPSELYAAMEEKLPRLLLLDRMLPEEDGISVLRKLRAREDTRKLPVIMLTAKGMEVDKVEGLDSGADDYITKPFGTMELISRVKALLRRTEDDILPLPTDKDFDINAPDIPPTACLTPNAPLKIFINAAGTLSI